MLEFSCVNGLSAVFVGFFGRNLNNIPQRGCITVARIERFNLARPHMAKDQINFLASDLVAKLSVLRYLHGSGPKGSKRSF